MIEKNVISLSRFSMIPEHIFLFIAKLLYYITFWSGTNAIYFRIRFGKIYKMPNFRKFLHNIKAFAGISTYPSLFAPPVNVFANENKKNFLRCLFNSNRCCRTFAEV
jgi:hypothetical protein